ncbi:MAG TPA: DUF2891 domain-containing protein [Caulobacteraceae bacterium]|jgi:hypothetical protein
MFTQETAERFAHIALGHLTREYPNKLDHVMARDADAKSPKDLHPIFYGSFDWHSCVHGYWLLARVARRFPQAPVSATIESLFARQFLPEKVAAELAYLATPTSRGFERPYGWAWLLMLQAELEQSADRTWADHLRPLAVAFADRFKAYLPKADYPVRAGTHGNTAFALCLALDYARVAADKDLEALLMDKARAWYGEDLDCQAWEPSGDDFLSSALIEAECLRRVLDQDSFRAWFGAFLPRTAERSPATLFEPAKVSDRSDGKIAHLDGLNLSRAWCWRKIAEALGPQTAAGAAASQAAQSHLDASLPQVAGDYMGEHWLASFATLALDG